MKKFLILIFGFIISLSAFTLGGCDDKYKNVSLYSAQETVNVEVGGTASFMVEIKNYFTGMSKKLDVSFDGEYAILENIEYGSGNSATITVKGVKVGNGIAKIVTYEGFKVCNVKINVNNSLKSITLNQNPYVLLEENFEINLSKANYFTFNPIDVSNVEMGYYYIPEGQTQGVKIKTIKTEKVGDVLVVVLIGDESYSITSSSFKITAMVENNVEVSPVEMNFDIINPIEVGDLLKIKNGLDSVAYYLPSEVQTIEEEENITLVSNNLNLCYFEFELQIDTSNVVVKTQCDGVLLSSVKVKSTDYASTSENSYFFGMHAFKLGVFDFEIKVFYSDYNYLITKHYVVHTISAPISLQTSTNKLTLYDINDYSNAYQNIDVEVFALDSTFDRLEVTFIDSDNNPVENWSDYISVVYNNVIYNKDFSIYPKDFNNNVLKNSFKVIGKKQISNLFIKFKVVLEDYEDIVDVKALISVNVVKGASIFQINAPYATDIAQKTGYLVVEKNSGAVSFDSFNIKGEGEGDIDVGTLRFEYIKNADSILEITQNGDEASITINPKKVGDGSVRVYLPNGLFVTLNISIVEALTNVKLTIDSPYIVDSTYDANENITSFVICLENQNLKNMNFEFNLLTNQNASLYEKDLKEDDTKNYLNIDTQKLSFTIKESMISGEITYKTQLTLKLKQQKVEDFKRVDSEDDFEFVVNIEIYLPLTSVYFTKDGFQVNSIDLYNAVNIGSYYKDHSYAKAELDLNALFDGNRTISGSIFKYFSSGGENYSWKILTGKGNPTYGKISPEGDYEQKDNKIENFGTFDIVNNKIIFNCENESLFDNDSFWFEIIFYQYKKAYPVLLNINIKNFKPLDNVGFYNFEKEIYLSDSNLSYTFLTFMDEEADCQEFDVIFKPSGVTSQSLISISIADDYSSVKITYNGLDVGTGYGTLYFVPMSSFTSDTEFKNSTSLIVRVSDGSDINNPLRLSTADEFLEAMSTSTGLTKHYKILNTLDFQNIPFTALGTFSGSLVGENSSAKLINLNISLPYNENAVDYLGVFSKISSTGTIKNISFEGSINFTAQSSLLKLNSGFVCASNEGVLENVAVKLSKSVIDLRNAKNINEVIIGGVCGENKNKITNTISNKSFNSTLINMLDTFCVMYYENESKVSLGGVAGINQGSILRNIEDEIKVYNSAVYSVICNIECSNCGYVGGVAGENLESGSIENLLVIGSINNVFTFVPTSSGVGTGGVVGNNNGKVYACTSRVYVSSYDYVGGIAGFDNTVAGYSGGAIGSDYDKIQNCTIQATKEKSFNALLKCMAGSDTSIPHIGAISGNRSEIINNNIYKVFNNIALAYYNFDCDNGVYPLVYCSDKNYKYTASDDNMFVYQDAVIEVESISEDAELGAGSFVLDAEHQDLKNNIAYMFFYEAEDSSYQYCLNDLNLSRDLPFNFSSPDTIVLTSINNDVLEITYDGKVNLYKTGLAKIQVSSLLNKAKTPLYVYIYVINAYDNFEFITSNAEIIQSNSLFIIYEKAPVEFSYYISSSPITVKDKYEQNIEVLLKQNKEIKFDFEIYDGIASCDDCEIKLEAVAQKFILSVNGLITNKTYKIMFNPIYALNFDLFGDVFIENLNFEDKENLQILSKAKNGTEKITVSTDQISCEPLDILTLNITQITDYSDDTLRIVSRKITDGETTGNDYFNIIDFNGYSYDDINSVYKLNNYNEELNENRGFFKIQFNYGNFSFTDDYVGTYYLTFISDNGFEKTVVIDIQYQSIESLTLRNYYNIQRNFDPTKEEQNYVASSATNLLTIEVYPMFADYDYIYVHNNAQNTQNKNNFILFKLVDSDLKEIKDVEYLEDGFMISKSSIISNLSLGVLAKIYVKYTTTSEAAVDTLAVIDIDVLKKDIATGNLNIVFTTSKSVNVIIKDSVKFSIVGKENAQNTIYLAKGMEYELNLSIYGFTEDQIIYKYHNVANGGNAQDIVSVSKKNDKYYLTISDNFNYPEIADFANESEYYLKTKGGYNVSIETYGKNTVDGLTYFSDSCYLNFVIVDFVIQTENLKKFDVNKNLTENFESNSVIEGVSNGHANVAIGNNFNLNINLKNDDILEYKSSNKFVVNEVSEFKKSLKNNSTWKVIAQNYNILDPEFKSYTITSSSKLENSKYLRIKGYSVSPMKMTENEYYYYFDFSGSFTYKNGVPCVSTLPLTSYSYDLSTHFVIDSYSVGTDENAIPVSSYEDLISMKEGAWYIQMADITLPSSFEPINTKIAGFNGNGYSISYAQITNFENKNTIGVFGIINESSLIKNVQIYVKNSTNININSNSSVNFALLAGENYGAITNCFVVCDDLVTFLVNIEGNTELNYVAGLVAVNNGVITHSHVSMNLHASANVAGFVCTNSGTISSSYVKDSAIINKSGSSNDSTAGFVLKNGTGANSKAVIDSCYVSGEYNQNSTIDSTVPIIYSQSTSKILRSDPQVAGFVFENYSKISNTYSDILIISQSLRSGYVFYNAGTIENSYSTSTFASSGQATHGFIYKNYIKNNNGTLLNCYLLTSGTVNYNLNTSAFEGLECLTEKQFAQQARFDSFIISDSINKDEGVWFYPSKDGETMFSDNDSKMYFTYGRPELVSPNIISYSQKALDTNNVVYDETTQTTKYAYYETKNNEGSKFNPFVIYSAESFEKFVSSSSNNNVNKNYYRIVNNIDYSVDGVYNSKLYKTVFRGVLEGNNLSINGYVIDTKETLQNAGLFAKIGDKTIGEGVVKNLSLNPKYINLPNASNVGGLAGSLESGKIYNVSIDGFKYDKNGIVVIGYNAVGGVVGKAINTFTMINVSSAISVRASYTSSNNNLNLYSGNDKTKISYAGTVVGVADNFGIIKNVSINNSIASIAEIAGMMFGRIGENVSVSNINFDAEESQFVRANYYGGVVVGELSGFIKNINVLGENNTDFFKSSPSATTCVGGICGLMLDGSISDCVCDFDLIWSSQSPDMIGGIVGECVKGQINNTKFFGDITANSSSSYTTQKFAKIGGIIARIAPKLTVSSLSKIDAGNVKLNEVYSGLENANNNITLSTNSIYNISIGGLVGEIQNDVIEDSDNNLIYAKYSHSIANSAANTNLYVNSINYGAYYTLNIGGLIGAVYAELLSDFYAGEIQFNSITELNNIIDVKIKNMKDTGTSFVNCGEHIGLGYVVSEYKTFALDASTKSLGERLVEFKDSLNMLSYITETTVNDWFVNYCSINYNSAKIQTISSILENIELNINDFREIL